MKRFVALPVCWGIIHGLNDFISGFMLSHFSATVASEQSYLMMIIYAVLAFGGQLPLGLWLDHQRSLKRFGLVAVFMMLISIVLAFTNPMAAVVCVGLASAGIHVVGGSVCVMVSKDKTGPLAVFTAPGVLGLTLGILSGYAHLAWLGIPAIIGMFCLATISRSPFPLYVSNGKKEAAQQFDGHDIIMLVLLLIMCFRSFIYDVVNQFAGELQMGILVIGLSAFAGKIIGGFMADQIGWKKWMYISLPLAFVFLHFGKDNLYMLAFGIACLQSSVPITHLLMYKAIPAYPATATALTLGTAIALAGLPFYAFDTSVLFDNGFSNNMIWIAILVASIVLWIGILLFRKMKLLLA